jgi:hypothetical protein
MVGVFVACRHEGVSVMRKFIYIAAIGAICSITPALAQSGPDNPTATHF